MDDAFNLLPIPSAETEYNRGYYAAVDAILHLIQTLDKNDFNRKVFYRTLMEMRPGELVKVYKPKKDEHY